ncbi:MAG: T9SS type A sorting domain-containing protein, partial [Ignavibacteriales bacterium]|nr:T9SS type A sorting domain-containing protein [Ignavibacteriales bacterium]
GTANLGSVSLTTTENFDAAVDLTSTAIAVAPNTLPSGYSSIIGNTYFVVTTFGTPGTFTADMSINFGADVLDSRAEIYPAGVKLFKRNSTSDGAWTEVGNAVSANSATGVVTWSGITSFSQFAAVYEESALPVELVSFTATSQRLNTHLEWNTASEVNNYGFEIERTEARSQKSENSGHSERSEESSVWIRAGFVEGNGTTNAPNKYSFTDKNLSAGKYLYRLKQIDRDGKFSYSQEVEVTVGNVPKVFALEQNYPNPFNPTTTIGFTLEKSGMTTLKIYDAIGREIATLVNEFLEAGVYHQRTFSASGGDASKLASGIYFAKLSLEGKSQIKKLMLVR